MHTTSQAHTLTHSAVMQQQMVEGRCKRTALHARHTHKAAMIARSLGTHTATNTTASGLQQWRCAEHRFPGQCAAQAATAARHSERADCNVTDTQLMLRSRACECQSAVSRNSGRANSSSHAVQARLGMMRVRIQAAIHTCIICTHDEHCARVASRLVMITSMTSIALRAELHARKQPCCGSCETGEHSAKSVAAMHCF